MIQTIQVGDITVQHAPADVKKDTGVTVRLSDIERADGGDYDEDGRPDLFSGDFIEESFTIIVVE